jgi:hypothetical protein
MMRFIVSSIAAAIAFVGPASAELPRHPDAPARESQIGEGAQSVSIPLNDGTTLAADLYLPDSAGPHPVILEVTPYGRRSTFSSSVEHGFWTGHGYAFIVVDARGTGASEGTHTFMADARRDGPQIVEWAAAQRWSSGKVGMRGSSYSGTYPIQTAIGRPRGLACISPNANFQSGFDGPPFLGGAFMQGWALGWTPHVTPVLAGKAAPVDYDKLLSHRPLLTADLAAHGVEIPVYRQFLEHQTSDNMWADVHLSLEDYRRINVPALTFTGWYDTTLPGSIANYRAMRGLAASADDQWIIVGPWDHYGASEGGYSRNTGQPIDRLGALAVESRGYKPGQRMAREFFDWCLKGTTSRPAWPSVQMFVPGQNRWIEAERFPSPLVKSRKLFLGGAGRANAISSQGLLEAAPSQNALDEYTHNPANPVRSDLPANGRRVQAGGLIGPVDISHQLARPDVLTYATPPLTTPVTLLGNARLSIYVQADVPDFDMVALLEDVAPNGTAIRLDSGWAGVLRARYRSGSGRLALLKPDETVKLEVNLGEKGHTLGVGHRLRLSVFSSAYPFISVNPGTGNDIATDNASPRSARITILRGSSYPSALSLEVLEPRVQPSK